MEATKEKKFYEKVPVWVLIMIGMAAGAAWGVYSNMKGLDPKITTEYIKPIGDIFIFLLKLVAIPLILASIVTGITSIKEMSILKIGLKTFFLFLITTVIAICVGLVLVNFVKPGLGLSEATQAKLMQEFHYDKPSGTDYWGLAMYISLGSALVIGLALFFGKSQGTESINQLFSKANDFLIKIIGYIMYLAPFGVFALIANQVVSIPSADLLKSILSYALIVIGGMVIMYLIYLLLIAFFTTMPMERFIKGVFPVQILAFSSSSSNATLPLTMRQAEGKIGISEDISGFVLPLGATVNMDGTSLYQAVATVFICQATHVHLGFQEYALIVGLCVLASAGAAGVPSAGLATLSGVLTSVGANAEAIALIIAPDRILDMFRTAINVTSDITCATLIANSEKKLAKRR